MPKKLSASMSQTEFENGYWYIKELKDFAQKIGIPSAAGLRKDELEKAILYFLKTGKIKTHTKRNITYNEEKDIEKGLKLSLKVINYTNNKTTKEFIEKEARKMLPDIKKRSGSSYRLNRWREEQIFNGKKITYKDLVIQYIKLNTSTTPFAKIPHGRYINFISDFLRMEKNGKRNDAIKAWKELKDANIPKTYPAWKKFQN